MSAKSVGDMPAFACEADGGCGPWPGMTYRQWLIGQSLCGFVATGGYEEVREVVEDVFRVVNAIIRELDKQKREEP